MLPKTSHICTSRANFGQVLSKSVKFLLNAARLAELGQASVEIGAMFVGSGPNSTWSISVDAVPILAESGPRSTAFGPISAKCRPGFGNNLASSTGVAPFWAKFGMRSIGRPAPATHQTRDKTMAPTLLVRMMCCATSFPVQLSCRAQVGIGRSRPNHAQNLAIIASGSIDFGTALAEVVPKLGKSD